MAITTFAAIDVGSSELSMKIFELSKSRGITELTHLRHKLLLGAETYATGSISYTTLSELCEVLKNFSQIMTEYDCTNYSAYATSAVREAENNLIVLNQIKIQTGFKVKIISTSEQRLLRYKAIALKDSFFDTAIEKGTLIVDSGAGSVQFSLFSEGVLVSTQNLKLGSSRIYEILGEMETESGDYADLIAEYMEKDIETLNYFYLQGYKIKNIIAVGDRNRELKELILQNNPNFDGKLSKKEFMALKIPKNRRSAMLAPVVLIQKIFDITDADSIYFSGIDLCDSMVAEYAEKKLKMVPSHDFQKDILAASRNIARKYRTDLKHTENVECLALNIFDQIRKIHGLGKRERLLLQIAVILHSCGAFVNLEQTRENSYKIILSTEIIGLSHRERVLIANVVRYNHERFPDYRNVTGDIDREDYITAVKLSALLRLANTLDKSNRHKINRVRISLKENNLLLVVDTLADITLEQGIFLGACDAFADVFGIRPVLKQKRGINSYGKI